MDSTISVSKGCFVFKNGATRAEKGTTKSKKSSSKQSVASSLLGKEITDQPFYKTYSQTWSNFLTDIETLQRESYSKTLKDLVDHIGKAYNSDSSSVKNILPAAALLTGINQPDHHEQFETLSQRIREELSASVCVIQSRDCSSVKAAVETMVYGFVEEPFEEDEEDRDHKRLRRSQCTMQVLAEWHKSSQPESTLVVILPDFECFNGKILQDFILILSSYCSKVPIVLILGVATAVSALHSTLPYHVTSKIRLKIFQTQAAPVGLNEILEKVILSPKHSVHLSGKAFKFLTHIFLFYDFSINGFIQGFKYCLMEHFFQGNAYALCTSYFSSLKMIKYLTHEDMETIRHLLSFRPYVESLNDCQSIIAILTDDGYLKKKLPKLLRDCHLHFIYFRAFLEFLTVLVQDLPKSPMGKLQRELYSSCLSKDITETAEFKESWQMLAFMSKDEFVANVSRAITTTIDFINANDQDLDLSETFRPKINEKLDCLKELLTKVVMAGMEVKQQTKSTSAITTENDLKQMSRQDLKEKLLQMSKQEKPISDFTRSVNETLEYIKTQIVEECLKPLTKAPPLYELFVFSDIANVRRNIIGAPRAALHMALNNPHYYLQCKCCELDSNLSMVPTLPDLSVAYKLHLECGKMINLFDWLQSFRSVLDYSEEDQEQVDPEIQARFTRAVAELQFLGYIKTSKRKTDHVTRLTW
ncbi:origin recognition complex subunit 3 [Episyrphus balteatus]|uniref:origin recognition complex subunit 3 n=1 Tax=Episyrphus balteatus TaxID=286459 RepID=UPI0024856736|nr:origin recognition complex subunit 3 [Episyrphus balteatus]